MSSSEAVTLVDLGDFGIRRKVLDDGLDDYLWRRDPETSRLDGSDVGNLPLSDFLARLRADLESPFAPRQWFALANDEGVHFGTIVLSVPSWDSTVAEVGITIGRPEFRGHGVGKRAMVGFLRYIWETTQLRTIQLHTFEWNRRARGSFLRSGFQEAAKVVRNDVQLVKMETRRDWWLMWDGEGRFEFS